jgi:ankyrin repeat protein
MTKDNNCTLLFDYIEGGDTDACARLLKNTMTDLNVVNDEGNTPLTEAIMQRSEDIATLLLESGADPNAGDSVKPIHLVAGAALSPQFLRKLIAAGADVNMPDKKGMPPLFMTFDRYYNNQEITQILLDAGASTEVDDGKGFTLTDYAMMSALDLEITQKYSEDDSYADFTPYLFPYNLNYAQFIRAAMYGDYEALKSQLENQKPDKIMTLALHETLTISKYECCRLLLECGDSVNSWGITGFTPLAETAAHLELEITELLLSYGADPNKRTNGGLLPQELIKCLDDDISEAEYYQKQQQLLDLLQ